MARTSTNNRIKELNTVVSASVKCFTPPENLTVSAWADKYRRLSAENSEAGPWRTTRTPYLREIMDAFTDPKVRRIVVAAASQVGKSEMELNMIGYAIDVDPGPIMFVLPTLDVAKDFSKRRIAPMIRDTKSLREKVGDAKSRDSDNTLLKKSYPGGMLTITGANSPASLASIPARYVFGDERDRWPRSSGTEGDPWGLVEARTRTFYNSKMVEVSTPTIKGASNIEEQLRPRHTGALVPQVPQLRRLSRDRIP
jgi:phage terminase large subunit GpA-like protein